MDAVDRARVARALRAPGFAAFDQALKDYPAIGNRGLSFASSPGRGAGVLEYWSPDEEGTPSVRRPRDIPMGKVGVEAIDPKMRPIDVLGDVVSHDMVNTDPKMMAYYSRFISSMTPKQQGILREQYDWATRNEGEKRPFNQWAERTGLPGYFRGYAFKQWPDEFNRQAYTPEQLKMFDEMMAGLRK